MEYTKIARTTVNTNSLSNCTATAMKLIQANEVKMQLPEKSEGDFLVVAKRNTRYKAAVAE